MTVHLRSKSLLRGLAGVAAAAVATGVVVFAGAGPASAADATLTLNYSCPFPLIGNQTLAVVIDATLPDSVDAGGATGSLTFSTAVTVPANASAGLSLVGATTVSGTATADSTVTDGSATLPVSASLTIPSTPVPASGAFTVNATGSAPSVTLPNAGTATVDVGNFSTTLTPLNASGQPTSLGTFTSDCTLVAGQNTTLGTITVNAPTTTTTTPPTTTTTTTTPPTTTTTTTTTTPPTTTTTTTTTTTSAPPPPVSINFAVNGSTHLKGLNTDVTLGPGTLPVSVDLTTGAFTGDLTLPSATAQFKLLGFIPGSVTFSLVPTSHVTGALSNGVVSADAKDVIHITDMSLFGLPVIHNSTTCETNGPADIPMQSGPNFNIATGGTLTGTYTIPSLQGCGLLTPLISAFAAGSGNTISVTITPSASAAGTSGKTGTPVRHRR
jgi:hypothetical protein